MDDLSQNLGGTSGSIRSKAGTSGSKTHRFPKIAEPTREDAHKNSVAKKATMPKPKDPATARLPSNRRSEKQRGGPRTHRVRKKQVAKYMTPAQAMQRYMDKLTNFEQSEILEYSKVLAELLWASLISYIRIDLLRWSQCR